MNSDEKASLEKQVAKNPNDIESRTKLLGYYFINGRQDPDARSARRRHVEWLIENAPESECSDWHTITPNLWDEMLLRPI